MSYRNSFSKAPRVLLLLTLIAALVLLALACAPAQAPTAAPTQAAPAAQATAAAPEATAVPSAGVAPTTGRYAEKAGLRIFIPEGYQFGGPIIPSDPRPPRYGGIGIYAYPGDPPSLDPYHTTSYLNDKAMTVLYDRLIQYNNKGGVDPFKNPLIPGLAESWQVSDDFLTYTFHLRQGVKFHNLPPVNGRELDTEDVKATVALYTSPASVAKPFYDGVDRVEVIDRYTVAFHMKQVEPTMLNTLSESIRGSILPREQTDPASLARRPGGIGTGPFMAVGPYEYKIGITLKRNPDYWKFDEGNRLPYLDRYKVVIIPDNSARLTAFRTGKIDTGAGVVPGGLTGLRGLMKTNPTTLVQEYVYTAGGGCSACFRLDKAPWNDVRVRRALSLATDYEAIAQTVHGVPPLLVSSLIAGVWYGSDDTLATLTQVCSCPWYSYDPQRAKALLAEAGFPNGFSTEMVYFPYTQQIVETAELLAAYWKSIGVEVKLISQDYTVYRPNVDRGGWDNLGLSFTCCPSLTSVYGAMDALIPGGGRNPAMGFPNDPQLTALAKEVIASFNDEAKRGKLVREARARYLDQVMSIPSVGGPVFLVFAPRLRNYQSTTKIPTATTDTHGFVYTWIDDDYAFNK